MSNSITSNAQSAAQLRAASPDDINKLFNEKLRRGSKTEPLFTQWSSPKMSDRNELSGAPIEIINDFKSKAGSTVRFTVMRGLNTAPVLGEGVMMGKEHKFAFGGYNVNIDYWKHSAGWGKKAVNLLAARGGVVPAMTDEVLDLIRRTKQHACFQRLRERVTVGGNLFGVTSINNLTATDFMSTRHIQNGASYLQGIGGRPIANKSLANGAKVGNFLFFGPSQVLDPLYDDPTYNSASLYAADRGSDNTIFGGGFQRWRNQDLFHFVDVEEDVIGPIGNHFAPKARLGVAIAPGTAALALKGGGTQYDEAYTPVLDYFRDFPGGNAIGKLHEEEVRPSDTGSYFIKIVAPDGKWNLVRYIGDQNLGTGITTANFSATTGEGGGRLSATANVGGADTRHTTVGTVVFNPARHTEALPQGSLMYLASKDGTVVGYIGVLGSSSLLIANGSWDDAQTSSVAGYTNYTKSGNQLRGGRDDNYGHLLSAYVEEVCGVDVPRNSSGGFFGHLLMPRAYTPPGITIL